MTTSVITLREDQTLGDAIKLLVSKKLSGAPVLGAQGKPEQGKLVGVLSEFDCMKVLVASSFHHEGMPAMRAVSELMSTELYSVTPETDLYAIAHIFTTKRIRRLPVVEGDRLVGLISRRDVMRVMGDMLR
jgi:CBS domain-containing protein